MYRMSTLSSTASCSGTTIQSPRVCPNAACPNSWYLLKRLFGMRSWSWMSCQKENRVMIHERIKTTMPGPLHTSKSSFNQEWNFFLQSCYCFLIVQLWRQSTPLQCKFVRQRSWYLWAIISYYQVRKTMALGRPRTPALTTAVTLWKAADHQLPLRLVPMGISISKAAKRRGFSSWQSPDQKHQHPVLESSHNPNKSQSSTLPDF